MTQFSVLTITPEEAQLGYRPTGGLIDASSPQAAIAWWLHPQMDHIVMAVRWRGQRIDAHGPGGMVPGGNFWKD